MVKDVDSKRVDFSGRTVITPDPTIDINQLGVPIKMAMTLTFPEVVTPHNINRLEKLVRNGRHKYPGANFVFPISERSGRRIAPLDLRYRKEVRLRYGDIVERHLVDDDYVLLNRQPTLHKLSMMGHRIKVIHNEKLMTLRLNVAVCEPYNADFDGDEMNIFVPQSIQTMIELAEIADAKRQFITPRMSVPIIGLIQDGLLGAYNLTSEETRINWKEAMNIMAHTEMDDYSVIKKNKKYTGGELFSMIIPEKINLKKGDVEIKKGELKKGRLNKGLLGPTKSNSIIHLVWNEYGMDIAKKFVDNSQRLVNNFNLHNGFSVGIGDMYISPDIEKQLHRMMETKILETKHHITDMENNPDMQDQDIFEDSIFRDLNAIRSNASKLIIDKMKPKNNFNIMLKSGSKGNEDNIGQMGGCVGQQVLEGARIKKKVNGRSLPYFHQNDDTAEGRGFVRRPFLWGLKPTEFIFHNMTSREGLIDTAIRTASSGYIQRKLIKSEEDIYVSYDLTVRTMNNTIIQFIYGDSGIDTTRQYSHDMKIIKMDNTELASKYKFTKQELKNFKNFSEADNNKYYKLLIKMRDEMREAIRKRSLNYITLESSFMLPINFKRIVSNLREEGSKKGTKLEPKYVLDKFDNMVEYENTQLSCMTKETAKNKKSLKYKDEIISKYMFKFALHEFLSPKVCIFDMGLSKETFDKICKDIIKEYNGAVIEAGEMVGVISAQSIGEPVKRNIICFMAGVGDKTPASP